MSSEAYRIIAALGGIGILTPEDLPSLDSQRWRVLVLMADGRWHSGPEVVAAANGSEGLRRLRELRRLPGVEVLRKRDEHRRIWLYRIIVERAAPIGESLPLFPAPVDERDAVSTAADYRRATDGE